MIKVMESKSAIKLSALWKMLWAKDWIVLTKRRGPLCEVDVFTNGDIPFDVAAEAFNSIGEHLDGMDSMLDEANELLRRP